MKSDKIDLIIPALLKAQGALEHAPKDSENPHFKSSYADLATVLDTCKPALQANKLLITHQRETDSGLNEYLVTILWHESGQFIGSRSLLNPVKKDPQGMGSAITYARRYDLSALIGLASEADDDGNNASKGVKPTGTPQAATQAAPKAAPDDIHEIKTLVALATQATGLSDFEKTFVADWEKKIAQYGDKINKPSEKQLAVLKKCAAKAKPIAPSQDDVPDYLNDEIPY